MLDALDAEIALLEDSLAAVRLQKRAVMQKLLSGEIELPKIADAPTTPAPEAEMPS